MKVIRARTLSSPVCRSFCLARLVSRSATATVGGSPEALDGFSSSLRFFATEALSGEAASLTETLPLA